MNFINPKRKFQVKDDKGRVSIKPQSSDEWTILLIVILAIAFFTLPLTRNSKWWNLIRCHLCIPFLLRYPRETKTNDDSKSLTAIQEILLSALIELRVKDMQMRVKIESEKDLLRNSNLTNLCLYRCWEIDCCPRPADSCSPWQSYDARA